MREQLNKTVLTINRCVDYLTQAWRLPYIMALIRREMLCKGIVFFVTIVCNSCGYLDVLLVKENRCYTTGTWTKRCTHIFIMTFGRGSVMLFSIIINLYIITQTWSAGKCNKIKTKYEGQVSHLLSKITEI